MKKIILIIGLVLTVLLALFATADNGLSLINKKYGDCVKNCTTEKKAAEKVCLSTFTNSTKVALLQNKECLAAINSTNKTIVNQLRANCSNLLRAAKNDALNAKFVCLNSTKTSFPICLNICKQNRETELGNFTNASLNTPTPCNVSSDCPQKICVGQTCRGYNCINHLCSIPRAINGWDPAQ